jgi:hypothetical protein
MKNMRDKNSTNSAFQCAHCGKEVSVAKKTARNHCNHCLWSLHIDAKVPGDRLSKCRGLMPPVAIFQKQDNWIIIHNCEKCGKEINNKCCADDNFEIMLGIGKQL